MENSRKIKYMIITVVCLFILSILISFSTISFIQSLKIVFGSFYVLFLPGFILSYLFFKKGKIDWIERIALSFALSIAIVPLFIFYLNMLGMKLNFINCSLAVLEIILISIMIKIIIKRRSKK